jgi:carboxymethylenebutenolidase
LLHASLIGAGVGVALEIYPARHGFAVADNPTYDADAAARHWSALSDLYAAALPT